MNGKSIKKICFISFLLLAVLLFYFSFQLSGFHPYAKENFEKYSQGLAEISEKYLEEYDSRIIVKSDRILPDRDSVLHASGFAGLNVFQYKNASDADKALDYYSSLSYVDYAVKDALVSGEDDVITEESGFATAYTPAEIDQMKAGHLSWGAEMLGVDNYQKAITDKYEALGTELPTVYVAVLDTGVDTDNEYLQGRIATQYGRNYYESFNPTKFEDGYGHGTHVSGTITDLTLPNVKIIPVKVLNDENSGSVMGIVNGMQYVIKLKQEGVNIVAYNMSLGGLGQQQSEYDAIISSYQNNMLTVVSAGNSSYYGENYTPGNCETALTISALAENDTYEKFPHIADYSNYGAFVDLCLPGTNVLSSVPNNYSRGTVYTSSTGGKYALMSGTSMAAPHATALVALYATYMGADYDAEEAESTLKNSAIDLGDLGWDTQYGYGVPTMDFAFAEKSLTAEPSLSFGTVGEESHFQENSITVTITDENESNGQSKIYYSLDGSVPSLLYYEEYRNGITVDKSTFLRFVIYRFDGDKVTNRSEIYEVTYYKGDQTVNDDGTGFEINPSNGRLTSYTSGLKNVVIPEYVNGVKVTGFGKYLFRGLNVETVVAEQALHMNGFHPFYCTATLKSLSIGSANWNPVQGAPDLEFEKMAKSCYGLKELYLPNLTYLPMADQGEPSNPRNGVNGSKLFERCTNLEKIYAPKVTDVRAAAFSCFARLKEIELDWENLTKIGDYAFDRCSALEMEVQFAEQSGKTYTFGKHAFEGSGITGFQSSLLTAVPENAFADCKNLTAIELPEAETLGSYAFSGCENLASAELPALKTVGDYAFENCKNLTAFDLENIESIGKYAFSNAGIGYANLTNLQTMNQNSFSGCANLFYVILGSNANVINYSSAWLSSYNTKILLIDREYNGQIGTFIKNSYSFKYDFEEYDYLIYSVDQIYTVTFRWDLNTVIETRRFTYGSKITAPADFTLGSHAEITVEGWKEKNGQTYTQNSLPTASKNFEFTVDEYSAEFLTPHEESDWVTLREVGCTVDGLKEKYCTLCGELVDRQITDAHGHAPQTVVDNEATCTDVGLERSVCNTCGETLSTAEIPATGHTEETVVEREATCTVNGVLRTRCAVCLKSFSIAPIPAAHDEEAIEGHSATCTETGLTDGKRCKVCNEITVAQEEIPAKGHTWGDWLPVTEGAGAGNSEMRKCSDCDKTETRSTIDARKTADFVAKTEFVSEHTTAEGKYEAIKSALNAYALLSDAEKDSVADAYAKLLSEIDGYNASAEKLNGELNAAMRNGISVAVTAVATVALALASALGKRRFL